MTYSQPVSVSNSEYDFAEFESPGASDGPIDYSLNPYEEESEEGILCFYEEEEEEESSTHRKLSKILRIMDKLRELFLEILDEIWKIKTYFYLLKTYFLDLLLGLGAWVFVTGTSTAFSTATFLRSPTTFPLTR